jgi:hypothetical protein
MKDNRTLVAQSELTVSQILMLDSWRYFLFGIQNTTVGDRERVSLIIPYLFTLHFNVLKLCGRHTGQILPLHERFQRAGLRGRVVPRVGLNVVATNKPGLSSES